MESFKFQEKRLSQKAVVNTVPRSRCRLQQQTIPNQFGALLLFFITFSVCLKAAHAFPATAGNISEVIHGRGVAGLHTVTLRKQYVPISRNDQTVAYKTAYFGHVAVGNPPLQTFTAVFDTGSGHFILPSTTCLSEVCRKHRRYNRTLSSGATDIDHDGTPILADSLERDQVSIAFGTGEVLGEFVHDVVCIGEESSLCMELRVVLATQMTADPFTLFDFDGVIGLGLDALTLNRGFSFFGQLVDQNPRLLPRFAVFLALSNDEDSVISFGGHDPERAQSELQWAPVTNQELGHWQVRILAVRLGNESLEECADGTCRAILDTGTSLLGVPRQMARNMHRQLTRPVLREHHAEDVPLDKVDCRTVPGRSMEFDIEGGMTVSLKAEDYSRPAAVSIGKENGKHFCRSLLLPVDMSAPLGPKVFIWGEPVLRRYYTVYDLEAKEIGFALAKSRAGRSSQKNTQVGEVPAPPVGSLAAGAPLPDTI